VPRIVIHPGAPKTATTFLQNEVFDKHSDILNIGKPNIATPEHFRLYRALMYEEVDRTAESAIRAYFDKAQSDKRARNCKAMVYSNEILFDAPLSSVAAKRLHAVLPEAEIVLTLRNQLTLAASMYTGDRAILKHVPAPHAGKPVTFDAWFEHAFASADTPDAKCADYYRIYSAYAEEFGADQVHVLLYEQFIKARGDFMAQLSGILGIEQSPIKPHDGSPPVNPSPSGRLRSYQSLRSWFLPGRSLTEILPGAATIRQSFDQFLKRGRKAQVTLNAAQTARLRELYAPGNRELAKASGLDLEGKGYPV
jgi:hypothetical protein